MPYKLLLADDSLTIQKVVELVLANENFQIKSVNDGEAALQLMESFAPDIVLADIDMPKLNGYQICQSIKNNEATSYIPVILLAGAFEPFDEDQAKAVSADDFIIKPFESQELISKVKGLMASVKKPEAPVIEEPEAIEEPEEPSLPSEEPLIQSESVPSDDISWDDAFQEASGEKTEETVPPEEPPAASEPETEDPKGFGDELLMAMKDEAPAESVEEPSDIVNGPFAEMESAAGREEVAELPMPAVPDIPDAAGSAMGEKIESSVLVAAINDSVRQAVADIAPAVLENVTRELVRELLLPLRAEVEATIRKVVPEIAETIIKKEIEKITSGI